MQCQSEEISLDMDTTSHPGLWLSPVTVVVSVVSHLVPRLTVLMSAYSVSVSLLRLHTVFQGDSVDFILFFNYV